MTRLIAISFIVLALMGSAMVADAAPRAPQAGPLAPAHMSYDGPRYERLAQAKISPAEAKRIALSRVRGGEVVDIRRSGETYRVRVIARDGRVVDIVIDANTGRVR